MRLNMSDDRREKRKLKRVMDNYAKKYCRLFENVVKKDNRTEMFKILVALMRSGKTHLAIEHHIPFLFENTGVEVAIITAPLSGIVEEKKSLTKLMCTRNGYYFCEKPADVETALENGMKAALYMTNAGAFACAGGWALFTRLIEKRVMIATFMDEAWTWTLSDSAAIKEVNDNPPMAEYRASWYNIMSEVSKYSPYTYGMAATDTSQLDGKVKPTDGKLYYDIVIRMLDPIELSHRLAWMGDVTFFTDGSNLVGNSTYEEAINQMISSMEKREDKTGKKVSALIQAKVTFANAIKPNFHKIEDEVNMLKKSNYSCGDFDNTFSVLTSENTYLFSKKGPNIPTDETDIYRRLDDESDPLRFCIIMNMGKMGVTLRTCKYLFSCIDSVKENKYGYITFGRCQFLGRGLTPNCGESEKIFWNNYYGNLANVPNFDPEVNTVELYLHDNPCNRKAVEDFKENFCPTYEDFLSMNESEMDDELNEDLEVCPTCLGTARIPSNSHFLSDEEQEKYVISNEAESHLNEVLGIEKDDKEPAILN